MGRGLAVVFVWVVLVVGGCGRRRVAVGDSVAARWLGMDDVLVGVDMMTESSSSSSSETVYECLSFEGEVIGDAALRLVLGGE